MARPGLAHMGAASARGRGSRSARRAGLRAGCEEVAALGGARAVRVPTWGECSPFKGYDSTQVKSCDETAPNVRRLVRSVRR